MSFSAATWASDSDAYSSGVTILRTLSPPTTTPVRIPGNGRAPVPRLSLIGDYRKLRNVSHWISAEDGLTPARMRNRNVVI